MYVLGLTGPIGHGKSTLAKALLKNDTTARHIESSMVISEVANPFMAEFPKELLIDEKDLDILEAWTGKLTSIVNEKFGLEIKPKQLQITKDLLHKKPYEVEKLFTYISLLRQGVIPLGAKIDDTNKDTHRAMLQWLGGFLVKHANKGIWYEEIERRLKQAEKEGCSLYIVGGLRFPYDAEVIRRNGGQIALLTRKDLPVRESEDVTESERDQIKIDCTIESDASKEALEEMAGAIYEDILDGNLLKRYNSDDYVGIL